MSLIKRNLKCPAADLVIERKYRHRFRITARLLRQGVPSIHVSPLDAGFQDYADAIWPESWVYLPGQQMELFSLSVFICVYLWFFHSLASLPLCAFALNFP